MGRANGRALRRASALAGVLSLLPGCASETSKSRTPDAGSQHSLESDAFVWGYPLVVTHRTLQTFASLLGVNRLFNQTALSTANIRLIVAPNQDTLYSVAVLDLRSEPMVLTVPDVTDRYWTYQLLDGWTNSYRYIGTRATGGKGGTFAIVGPGYTGTLPAGMTRIDSPTPAGFLLGRFLAKDAADIAAVNAIVRTLVPLSTVQGTAAPSPPPPLGTAPASPSLTGTDGAVFFDELGDALAVNGPANPDDVSALARFQSLGIGPGLHPVADGDGGVAAALAAGVTDGLERLDTTLAERALQANGWRTLLNIGIYTSDFPLRAMVAKYAWGANVPEEAMYPVTLADASGKAYSGGTPYVMHLAKSELPPVDPTFGFWSVTLYGTDMYFVENSIQRYAIGDRTPGLVYNADGSLDLYIQNTAPTGHESNWLPSPAPPTAGGAAPDFRLAMRLYLPTATAQSGKYVVPPVVPSP